MMTTQIQFAFPYQQILHHQMVLQMPIEKMKDYGFGGVFSWESIANLHLTNSCTHRIPFVVIHNGVIIAYFNFERDVFNPTYISNGEMIVFGRLRTVIKAFELICNILKQGFGIKYITFATISESVADKLWRNKQTIGSYEVVYTGILRGACINMKQEIKDKNLFQIIL